MINRVVFCTFSLLAAAPVFGQVQLVEPTPTPVKVVITNNLPPPRPAAPRPTPTPIVVGASQNPSSVIPSVPATLVQSGPSTTVPTQTATVAASPTSIENLKFHSLGFRDLKNSIAAAKRYMQTRPLTTAAVNSPMAGESVRIAFNDSRENEIDYVVISKEAFLSTKNDALATSEAGTPLRIKTIRGNGVNTPIVIMDDRGQTHLPLLVQYPVVREGKYYETAYYHSTHPGVVTAEVVNAGRLYVRNVIEIARDRLKERGITVTPKIADIAERLATVEHVDHMRFRTEPHKNIYDDIFTLYALNEGQTYRYSVSSAGAGGMVQMIPSTYRMVRSWHPNIPLKADFVEGMRDHVNATQAMLLYMNRTWNDLMASPTVANAFTNGIATQEQLMAAGYNSNPARLAGYINRAGENWTNLIPRETKVYLQIYDSVERFVPMTPRTR